MVELYNYIKRFTPIQICVKSKENGEFLIVMNGNTEIYYLNDTARFVYQNITGKNSIQDIFELMVTEYEIEPSEEKMIKKDLVELVRDFQWQKIVKLAEVS